MHPQPTMWLLHQLNFFNHWSYNPFASRRRTAVLAITGPIRISEGDDPASCFWSFWYVIVFIVLYYIFLDHFVGIWNVFVIWDKDLIVTPSISSVWLYEFLNEKENVGLNKSFSTHNAHTLWITAWISSKVAPVKPPSSIKLNVSYFCCVVQPVLLVHEHSDTNVGRGGALLALPKTGL